MVDFGIYNKKVKKDAQEPGPSNGENVVTATSYIGVKASGSFDNDEATETELYKTQVEHEGRLKAGVNAAGEYLDQLKETAKAPFNKAGEALKGAAEQAENYVQDSASSLKDTVSESEQQAADKARRLASGSAERLKKIPGQVETAASNSYLSLSSLVPDRLKLARDDVARSWSRFKSKLYTPAVERNNVPKDPIQDFVRQMTQGRKPGYDYKHIVNKIRDALQDKGENFADGIQDSYQAAKDKSGEFIEGVKGTYQATKQKVNGAADFDIVSEAINQAPASASPRDFWRSVHNHLDNHNHPLASPISSFSYSPVPVTSLYLGLFTLSVAYSFSRRSCLTTLRVPKHPKEKSTETVEVGSSSILNHVAETYAWAPMAFFNILMLELNGYSGFTVFSIALVSLFGQLLNQYSLHVSTQESAKFATIGAVFVSAFLNTFTAITGSPVL